MVVNTNPIKICNDVTLSQLENNLYMATGQVRYDTEV